ncbi:MAG TPA: NAD-dependent epimerase/dehydratase family protein [Methanospirillum sp.]|nr:NAD-dependent epimerase/dehydratase family protein [Methanospirillum sp.]
MRSIVTGGAGFIGSHLVDHLVAQGDEVVVIDALLAGDLRNISSYIDSGAVTFVKANLLEEGWQDMFRGADRVWHLAADPDVRESAVTPDAQLNNTIIATHRVLEAIRSHKIPEIIFTSTSTVYGEATIIPTPETYTPMEPVSVYGAAKLACEALISAYCYSFGVRGYIFRFANIIGPRSGHGVITDFIKKIQKNSAELEILGDGKQTKSYLHVTECIRAIIYAEEHAHEQVNTFNIGSEDWIDVTTIADILVKEAGLSEVSYRFTGGSRGWIGDVPKMQLAIEKLKSLGWTPEIGSHRSVQLAVQSALTG